jgi:hypothetical protein
VWIRLFQLKDVAGLLRLRWVLVAAEQLVATKAKLG